MYDSGFDSAHFRKVLGHYPTGVCAITSMLDGSPVGMSVGSFTSVSLDPPIVDFFPDCKSSTLPKFEQACRFCVNLLSVSQQDNCSMLALKVGNQFYTI